MTIRWRRSTSRRKNCGRRTVRRPTTCYNARTGATDASAWLYANANRLEDDAIDSLAREIAARRDSELALRNMSDSLGNYWGQFESEDAYKEALAQ